MKTYTPSTFFLQHNKEYKSFTPTKIDIKPKTIDPNGITNISPYGTNEYTKEIIPKPMKQINIIKQISGMTLQRFFFIITKHTIPNAIVKK